MYKTSTEIKVGIFVLLGMLVLGWMAFRLGTLKSYRESYYSIDALFDQVTGLKQGVAVEIAGISVGHVGNISLHDDKAQVTLLILNGVTLPTDTHAYIKSQGILGDKYVELVPGLRTADTIAPGGHLEKTTSSEDMTVLVEKLSGVADDLKKLTSALTEEGGTDDIRAIIQNVKEVSENLNNLAKENGPNLTNALASLEKASQNLETITEKVSRGEGTLGQLINSDGLIREVQTAIGDIRDIAGKINRGEGTIGKLVNDDTTVNKLDEVLTGVSDFISEGDSISVALDFRVDFMTRYSFVKGGVGVKIFTSPDRYYLLGVTADYFGSYERQDFTDGNDRWFQESRNRSKLKINAQIAQRFYNFVIRGGVMESGGGLGVDYYLLDDDLVLTFEAFSGDFDHNPHLRAMATYKFWKFMYISAGYDDFISDLHRASPFFGIGFLFTDDDLKLLFGSAGSLLGG
ncbi:MAG: MCE family protein [Deltaproteobacteria bacterium]|jgi:phospholipid/cholesterol/gamma-HCH transport system substrate-binding protein|nr:MCE family protein [Deltaproteobacteria bacterium]